MALKKKLKSKKQKGDVAVAKTPKLLRDESLLEFGKRNILYYATEVNLERSVPDLYDGLKPVQRRILWAASQQVKGQFVKSARVVGDVIGKYHPHGDCLDGSTLVYTLDGRFTPIEDLVGSGSKWVLSYDEKQKRYVPALAHSWRVGQRAKITYEINLSDGTSIEATGNHQFYSPKKGWVKTEDLSSGVELLGSVLQTPEHGYPALNGTVVNTAVHRVVAEARYGVADDEVVHHKNEIKTDNRPKNLEVLDRGSHAKEHPDNYNEGLDLGRVSMFKSRGKLRKAIAAKNASLMQTTNEWLWLIKAMKIGRHAIKKHGSLSAESYEASRTIIYNGTRLSSLIERDISLDRLQALIDSDWKPDYSSASGFTEKIKKAKRKQRKGQVAERTIDEETRESRRLSSFTRVVRYALKFIDADELDWETYTKFRKQLIRKYSLKYGSIRVHKIPNRVVCVYTSPKAKWLRDNVSDSIYECLERATPRHGLFIVSVNRIKHEERKPMYDFTVDGYANMLIAIPNNQGNTTMVVAHNSASYGAMVTMVQSVVPYLEGKGNWGTLVDPPAAHRYTNVRMGTYGNTFFDPHYMNKAVTTFVPNYDDKEVEPVTLPALLPNVIINGNEGIGWGITTSMPSFRPDTVIEVLIRLLNGEKLEVKDFATTLKSNLRWGGRLVKTKENRKQWMELFKSSQASIQYEAELEVDVDKRTIVIDNWPPGLTPDKFVSKVREYPEVDKVYNSKGTTTFTITAKKGYNSTQFDALVAKVQKATQVKKAYKINVTKRSATMVDGVVGYDTQFLSLSVPELIVQWLKIRLDLEKRSLTYRIEQQKEKIAYTELLIYATTILEVIFKSLRRDDSAKYISKNSKLTLDQAKQILELRVRQLSKLDALEMQKRLKEQKSELSTLESWLKKPRAKIADDLKTLGAQFVVKKPKTLP